MVIALQAALAGPVVCDPDQASSLLEQTHTPAHRVPVVAPELLPGLVLEQTTGTTRALLDQLCTEPDQVSLTESARWEEGRFAAYTYTLAVSRLEDCAVVGRSATLTVGVRGQGPLHASVLAENPPTRQPIGDCPAEPTYREEDLLDGADGPVRLVLQVDVDGTGRQGRILVRKATPTGFHEQVLLDPAPPHLLGGIGGAQVSLTGGDDPWVVVHHRTTREDGRCLALPGQSVWSWTADGWLERTGRDALTALADRGLWRLATDDGWFVVLTQDAPTDVSLLEARTRKRRPLTDEPLTLRASGRFPLMNAGFLFAAPPPWPTEDEAEAFFRRWPSRTGVYVRQGWRAEPACADLREPDASVP